MHKSVATPAFGARCLHRYYFTFFQTPRRRSQKIDLNYKVPLSTRHIPPYSKTLKYIIPIHIFAIQNALYASHDKPPSDLPVVEPHEAW